MEKDYIENLRVVAVVGGNKISKQNLLLLKEKNHLTDKEMAELNEYCNSHDILVYDEEENENSVRETQTVKSRTGCSVPAEEEIKQKKVRIITKHIMHLVAVGARRRVHERGWLCGTYASNVRKSVERCVMKKFNESEMDYIIEHLPTENDEDIGFMMVDADNPQMAMHYNEELNGMIPKLHMNRFYSDTFVL